MTGTIEQRLQDLGITLPQSAAPAANYVPFLQDGKTLWISGQLPLGPDGMITGKLGADLDAAAGAEAARQCGLNLIAQMQAATGNLDHVDRVLKLVGLVNATPDFTEHPAVINGASDLMAEVFGEAGRHARSAFGVASLPFGVAVEIEAVVRLK